MPKLTNNFRCFQITVKALLARRTKQTVHCTASLRRDTKRAAAVLRNVNHLNGVAVADIKQPLTSSVSGGFISNNFGPPNLSNLLKFGSKGLGEIRHFRKIACSAAMNPTLKLFRTERFLSEIFTKLLQPLGVKSKEVHFLRQLFFCHVRFLSPLARGYSLHR